MIINSLPHWNSWHDFFAMGGYAFYVWGSFGLTAFGVIWEIITLKQRHANAVRGALRQRLIQQAGQRKTSQEQSN